MCITGANMLLLVICLIALIVSAIAFGMSWGIYEMLSLDDNQWKLDE